MKAPTSPTSSDPTPVISKNGKRVRSITPRESLQLQQWLMDYRFVKEVEYLEREGRVPSRGELEDSLGMERGAVAAIRLGFRGVNIVQVANLFTKYRGDRDFIMFGSRNKELALPYIPGVGRLDKYEPYIHEYTSPARWRVGSRPETQNEYYPADPENLKWEAPKLKSIKGVGGEGEK